MGSFFVFPRGWFLFSQLTRKKVPTKDGLIFRKPTKDSKVRRRKFLFFDSLAWGWSKRKNLPTGSPQLAPGSFFLLPFFQFWGRGYLFFFQNPFVIFGKTLLPG